MKACLIDFGSTFTKVIIVDLKKARILARSKAVSTVETNVMISLERALDQLKLSKKSFFERKFNKFACSSAAGGLKMVAIGLVPELTAEAAKRAALGSGAKISDVYSYELTWYEMKQIEGKLPDIVLLSGGTDGGDRKTILHNAKVLANSNLHVPIVVAGNKEVSEEVKNILETGGKDVRLTENVMPELEELNIEPAKEVIREVFIKRIVEAKGLGEARELVDILMPTPAATLRAVKLLADGSEDEEGLGEILVIEIGGATTNVYSVAEGKPTQSRTIWRGLKEPYAKRTVEGDLGLRVSAKSLLAAGKIRIIEKLRLELGSSSVGIDIDKAVERISSNIGMIPNSQEDYAIDTALARAATEIAVERHVGFVQEIFSPSGAFFIQTGKDLTAIEYVIGSGGPIVYSRNPRQIIYGTLFNDSNPFLLKPKNPKLLIDRDYVLWAMGLLSDVAPEIALQILKRSLQPA